jgi:citrate/tricarballylate utilization protein
VHVPPSELPAALLHRGAHVATVCNACRYCEAYCPAFQALETRRVFKAADLVYLANLCHNCGECLYACQYAPPHEFGIDVPRLFGEIRVASYEAVSWPRPFGVAFRRYGLLTAGAFLASAMALMAAAGITSGTLGTGEPQALPGPQGAQLQGDFYRVLPHDVMVGLFGTVFLVVLIALIVELRQFWRLMAPSPPLLPQPRQGPLWHAWRTALRDAFTLRHLHSGDPRIDCTDAEEQRTPWRRWWHHCTMYGYLFCFASTSTAALYHTAFGWRAPYALTSVPVILGILGGLGLVIGPLGLLALRRRRDPALADPDQRGLDLTFTLLLLATSVTGLALLVLRESAAMGWLLLAHLACVLTLFVTMPFGKFVHGLLRTAALLLFALERSSHPVRPADADRR